MAVLHQKDILGEYAHTFCKKYTVASSVKANFLNKPLNSTPWNSQFVGMLISASASRCRHTSHLHCTTADAVYCGLECLSEILKKNTSEPYSIELPKLWTC